MIGGVIVQPKQSPILITESGIIILLGLFQLFSGLLYIGIGLASFEPELSALGVHIRLAERERINIRLVFQICQGVVNKPVGALVGTDGVDDVQQGGIGVETPVILGNLRGRVGRPFRETAFFDIFNASLLFEVSGRDGQR